MENILATKGLSLFLKNDTDSIGNRIGEVELVRQQMNHLTLDNFEPNDSNKYFLFQCSQKVEKIKSFDFARPAPGIIINFVEFIQSLPLDALLFFKDGYIHSLELYSCDGQQFDDLDLERVDVKSIEVHRIGQN